MDQRSETKPQAGIRYLNGQRFARGVLAGASRVIRMAGVLNDINVFPVADHDTGSNMSATMRALAAGCQLGKRLSLATISREIADNGLLDARGNSGAILVETFYGLAQGFEGCERVTTRKFAQAVRNAADRATRAVAVPREGTILTFLRRWADFLDAESPREQDFQTLLRRALAPARQALKMTTDQLDVLAESNVVDAGAQGLMYFLEGLVDLMDRGQAEAELPTDLATLDTGHRHAADMEDSTYRFCTECLITGNDIDRASVRARIDSLGDSIIVAGNEQRVRLHMHTDRPGVVFDEVARFGELQQIKAEDMDRQQESARRCQSQKIAVITDSGCDLPEGMMDELNVHLLPHRISFGARSYLAKVTLSTEDFYHVLERSSDHPQTSQPTPADYLRTFEFVASHFERALVLLLSGGVSGTFQSGLQIAQRVSERIDVIDTRTCSVGQGIIVMEAARAAQEGRPIDRIKADIDRRTRNMKSLLCVETLRYLMRGGRISRLKHFFGQVVGLKPIFQFDEAGGLQLAGRALRGWDVHEAFIEKVAELASGMSQPRVAISHALAPALADRYANAFAKRFSPTDTMITHLSPVMGVHGGKNCIGIALIDEAAP